MENVNRWYYTKDQLANTPSRKCDIDQPKELSYRQQAANFIQDMGQRLQLSQLCINTAIVYMHRFYVYHSFTEVHRNNLSISALFLAAKVEEQPRKLEHVIKVAHVCLHKDAPALDVRSESYAEKAQEVVFHENILLQTLGFVLAIEHPHTYVVKVCQLVKASKDLAQSSYLMATTSLHMTTMCIQYKPTVVACVCIHLACKWSSYLIEPCSEGREWFYYVDRTVTLELLEKLTQEFIAILETSPHRFKRKFCGKETASFQNPKSLIENAAKEAKEASASEKRNGLSIKKEEPSPGPSTSLSFDFCPDFDDKNSMMRYDKGPDYEHNNTSNKKAPEMQSSKKPPVMTVSKKAPEVKVSSTEKKFQHDTDRGKKSQQEIDSKHVFRDIDIGKKIQQDMDSKKVHLDMGIGRKAHEGDVSRKVPDGEASKKVNLADLGRKTYPVEANRKIHSNHPVDADRKIHSVDAERKTHAMDLDRKPHAMDSDRKPYIMDSDRKSHTMDSDRKSHITDSDRKSHTMDSDRKSHTMDSNRKPHAMDSDRKPHTMDSDRKPHSMDSDRKPHTMDSDRKPHTMDSDRKPHTMDSDRKPHTMDSDRKPHTMDSDRKAHSIHSDRKLYPAAADTLIYPGNVDRKIHALDSDQKPHVVDAGKKPVSTQKPTINSHIKQEPDVRIEPEFDLSHIKNLSQLMSEKRNGLSPIAEPSYDFPIETKPIIKAEPVENNDVRKRSSDSSHSKHERREKHKSKHSSKDRHNHSSELPPASIKVKIRKDIIPSLQPSSQKTVAPSAKPESPKPSLKIKLPKPPGMATPEPPPKPSTPALPKLVITKDKSGSGSYSTSHKKRSHTSVDPHHKNSHEPPPSKYQKVNHSSHQKDPHKASRHRSEAQNKTTFHQMPSYQNYPSLPPPPFPTFGGMQHGLVKLNPLPPPLPPDMPLPPLPPDE